MYDPFSVPKAKHVGRVAAELGQLAQRYGFSFANSVVLTRGLVSATVDHVVVDRFGVLIIDVEPYEGAIVLGADTGNKWSATYPDGRATEFRNPLYLNTGNENLVRQALGEQSIVLEPGQVRSAVIFVGADISQLRLVEVSALKVKAVGQISELFEARYNFPPNSGQLTAADIERIISVVSALVQTAGLDEDEAGSWQADPAVIAATQHALSVPPPPPARAENAIARPAELAGHLSGGSEGPSVRSALLTLGTILLIVLSLVAGVLFLPQLQAGSALAWTAALVLMVGIAELVSANIAAAPSNANKRRGGGFAGGAARFGLRLLLVFAFVAVCWLLVAGGVGQRLGETLTGRFESSSQRGAAAGGQPVDPGVAVAKKRLKEKNRQVFDSALNLNSPEIRLEPDGRTAYTWSYVPSGLSASQAASFTLTIDLNGRVVDPVQAD